MKPEIRTDQIQDLADPLRGRRAQRALSDGDVGDLADRVTR